MEESTSRTFIADILTVAAIAMSLWLTAEKEESVSAVADGDSSDLRMFSPVGEPLK